MRHSRQGMGLAAKISLLGVAGVLLTAGALVGLAVWQSGKYNALAQSEVEGLIAADLDHITQGVFNLVNTENEAVQQQVNANLNVAEHILEGAGGVSLSAETVTWMAKNQFTGEERQIKLPMLLVGGGWLGRNADPRVPTPIVDAVAKLVGETATLFQRMNEAGDMLRVGTTIKDAQGFRAIGTYIPAINPDGNVNSVIATVLKGQVFQGPASVLDKPYLAAYRPIHDQHGRLVGMLYVGVALEDVEGRVRQAILQTKVGQTGYVYVLGGKGVERGRYIVSQRAERDGENILESKDSDGRFVIKAILGKALVLKPGELATERYRWKNPGETQSRWKIARLAYFEPWDWVIGTSVYEDELQSYREYLRQGRVRMIRALSTAGLAITVIIGIAGVLLSWTIVRPIRELTAAAQEIMQGDLNYSVPVRGGGETGTLATTFNVMTSRLRQTLDGLRKSEEEYRRIFEGILEGLFQSTFEGRFLRVNPAMARLLGYESPARMVEEITDIRQQVYVEPKDRDQFLATIAERGEIHGFEVQIRRRDGQVIWVSITARVVLDEKKEPLFMEGFFTDITDRRRVEAELRQLNAELERRVAERTAQLEDTNRELETFSYSVSHDLRAPLRSLDGFSQAILEDYSDKLDEQGRDFLRRVRGASQRMGFLIDDLLRLSRVGRSEFQQSEVDFSALAVEVAEELQKAHPERRVDLMIEQGLTVDADPHLLRIVLENLIGNAWKFTSHHPQARIEVGMEKYEDGRTFFVRDDGAGFDMAFAGRLFGAFQRAHSKAEFEGTGIGLATVQRIIHRHGGRVWAEGAVEKGATVYFTLPGVKRTGE